MHGRGVGYVRRRHAVRRVDDRAGYCGIEAHNAQLCPAPARYKSIRCGFCRAASTDLLLLGMTTKSLWRRLRHAGKAAYRKAQASGVSFDPGSPARTLGGFERRFVRVSLRAEQRTDKSWWWPVTNETGTWYKCHRWVPRRKSPFHQQLWQASGEVVRRM